MALCSQSGAEGAQGLQGAGGVEARVPVACQEDTGGGATNFRPCLVTSGWGAWVGEGSQGGGTPVFTVPQCDPIHQRVGCGLSDEPVRMLGEG